MAQYAAIFVFLLLVFRTAAHEEFAASPADQTGCWGQAQDNFLRQAEVFLPAADDTGRKSKYCVHFDVRQSASVAE